MQLLESDYESPTATCPFDDACDFGALALQNNSQETLVRCPQNQFLFILTVESALK